MKQVIVLLSALFYAASACALDVFSNQLDKAQPIDTAQYKATYKLTYKVHPRQTDTFDDIRVVQIGRNYVKDYSDIIFHYDSLATADNRRGVDAFTNPSGQPYPMEITRSIRNRDTDLKYRLPMGIGTLLYTDTIPQLQWVFAADSTQNILGYECTKATAEFAGRSYTAWFTMELPVPYGPYKFGGLPGLILHIEDAEHQFVWDCVGFEKSNEPIMIYEYDNEKKCSSDEASKTIERSFKTPMAFRLAAMGGGRGRIMMVGKDGRTRDAADMEETPIPYIPLEIK